MSLVTKLDMQHDVDPKKLLMDELNGAQDKIDLFGARVLVATYRRPEKTKGGILLTDKAKDEDIYQGRVGLVVRKGPFAFKDCEGSHFGGKTVEIGQWCYYRPSDGIGIALNGVHCRIIEDVMIDGVVSHPDLVL